MANTELPQEQNFESLLTNHNPSGVVGITYAHSILVGRIEEISGPAEDVNKLDDGHFVIVPFIGHNNNEAPIQVRYFEGEPQNFGTPVATVSKDELMGAAKLAYGTGKSIVAVPTWDYRAGETTDRIKYTVFAEERKTAPSVDEDLTNAGSKAAGQISKTLGA